MAEGEVDEAANDAPDDVDHEEEQAAGDTTRVTEALGDAVEVEEDGKGAFSQAVSAKADGNARDVHDHRHDDDHFKKAYVEAETSCKSVPDDEVPQVGKEGDDDGKKSEPGMAKVFQIPDIEGFNEMVFGNMVPEFLDGLWKFFERQEGDGKAASQRNKEQPQQTPGGVLHLRIGFKLMNLERKDDGHDDEKDDKAEDSVQTDDEGGPGFASRGGLQKVEEFDEVAADGAGEEETEKIPDHAEFPAIDERERNALDLKQEPKADGGSQEDETERADGDAKPEELDVEETVNELAPVEGMTEVIQDRDTDDNLQESRQAGCFLWFWRRGFLHAAGGEKNPAV